MTRDLRRGDAETREHEKQASEKSKGGLDARQSRIAGCQCIGLDIRLQTIYPSSHPSVFCKRRRHLRWRMTATKETRLCVKAVLRSSISSWCAD